MMTTEQALERAERAMLDADGNAARLNGNDDANLAIARADRWLELARQIREQQVRDRLASLTDGDPELRKALMQL